jgi:hypothetical protein
MKGDHAPVARSQTYSVELREAERRIEMNAAWLNEAGVFLDMLAFWILSVDSVRSMTEARTARDEIIALERKAFDARYGFFAPSEEVRDEEDRVFSEAQADRVRKSDQSMFVRRRWTFAAMSLTGVGFLLQIVGGFMSIGGS